MQDPPHALKKLRNSLFNSNRQLQHGEKKFAWCVVEALLQFKKVTNGFDPARRVTDDSVHLTAWTKMRVGLAAGVMHEYVAKQIEMDVKPTNNMDQNMINGTVEYIRRVARFYEIMTDTACFKSMDDPRFAELDAIVEWFTVWKKWVDEQVDAAKQLPAATDEEKKAQAAKIKEAKAMFITNEAYEDLCICVHGFKNSAQYLFSEYSFLHVYPRTMSTNSLEAFFALARATGGHDGRVTAKHMLIAHMYFMSMRAYTTHLKRLNTSYVMPTAADLDGDGGGDQNEAGILGDEGGVDKDGDWDVTGSKDWETIEIIGGDGQGGSVGTCRDTAASQARLHDHGFSDLEDEFLVMEYFESMIDCDNFEHIDTFA
ncbi:hypothetical protein BCR44DRAFT_222649 [Catenaria anguillulae PL171]|uniref:Transposable element P transposase-like GTP-binding insertion domain-containing protein n=1 Tax=Catenaria anguillulae PL171 TaxID=765915 RepID=A0A1Y2HA28_9FUNG|nr:hypothetical protein BCR44DRAFT_222649 [Catenaria anguillulae PL171]